MGKTTDIVVWIQGYDRPEQQSKPAGDPYDVRSAVETVVYKQSHLLEVVGYTGGDNPDPARDIVQEINRLKSKREIGRICIVGGSAGGPNALEVARQVSATRQIDYVGISDGAFTKQSIAHPPQIDAKTKKNWFQTIGNALDFENQLEVHGSLKGFDNNSVNTNPKILGVLAMFGLIDIGAQLALAPSLVLSLEPLLRGKLTNVADRKIRQKAWDALHTQGYLIGFNEAKDDIADLLQKD